MERNYEEMPVEEINVSFLNSIKSFYIYFAEMGNKVHFPVKGFKRVRENSFITVLRIPDRLTSSMYNKIPDNFEAFSLIQDFEEETGKPFKKLIKVDFKKHGIKDKFLILIPNKFFYAHRNRRLNRILNITDEVYAKRFYLNKGQADVYNDRVLLAKMFRRLSLALQKSFPLVDVNFIDNNDSMRIQMVREYCRPLWEKDFVSPRRMDKSDLWIWNGKKYPYLGHYDLEKFYKENASQNPRFNGQELYKKKHKFKCGAIFPICFTNKEDVEKPLAYIEIQSHHPLNVRSFDNVKEELSKAISDLERKDEKEYDIKCRILNFSSQGAKIEIFDSQLLKEISESKRFRFSFYFPFDTGEITIKAKMVDLSERINGATDIGVRYEAFEKVAKGNGALMDGKLAYSKAISEYKKEFLLE